MSKLGRRLFVQLGLAGFIALILLQWNKLVRNKIETNNKKSLSIPFNKNKAIDFIDDYIIINKKENITVFSAHCTHLGCKINETIDGKIVCPCHGSEYDLNGNAIKGPAYKSLEKISATISDDGSQLLING